MLTTILATAAITTAALGAANTVALSYRRDDEALEASFAAVIFSIGLALGLVF